MHQSIVRFDKATFRELMEFATMSIEFSFDNIMYRQIDGLGMGNILAGIFVGYNESLLFLNSKRPLKYRRYVDDIFSAFDSKNECDEFLKDLNNMHPSLQFTVELEENNQLPFLDILIEKSDNHFITSVYRKPTFSGLYQRWDSFCSEKTKRSLVFLLVHRAINRVTRWLKPNFP